MRKNKKMIEELQNPTVETVDTIDEVTEDDNFLFPDDESESNGDLNLDGDLDPDDDEFDDDDLDPDDDGLDDDDFDSDDNGVDDDDLDSDDDEANDDDDFDDDNDEADDDDIFSDTTELENDPFEFDVELRKPALPANKKMLMTAKEIDYKIVPAEESTYGNEYKRYCIVCEVKHPDTNKLITIKEFGTNKNAQFIKLVTCLNNGAIPKNLNEIVEKKAIVTITHNTDKLGNVWDNINTIEPYNPSSKKKAK